MDTANRIAWWLMHIQRLGEIPGARAGLPRFNPLWDAGTEIERQFGDPANPYEPTDEERRAGHFVEGRRAA